MHTIDNGYLIKLAFVQHIKACQRRKVNLILQMENFTKTTTNKFRSTSQKKQTYMKEVDKASRQKSVEKISRKRQEEKRQSRRKQRKRQNRKKRESTNYYLFKVKLVEKSLAEAAAGAASTMLARQQRNGRRYDVPQIGELQHHQFFKLFRDDCTAQM